MAAAIDGFYRGRDDEEAHQSRAAAEQFRVGQRQRVLNEQAREDQLRQDTAAIPTTRQVTVPNQVAGDDEGNAMPTTTKTVANPMFAQMRQQAEAFKKAGDFGKYLETSGKADSMQMEDAKQRVAQLEASFAGRSMLEVANMAKTIFDEDPFPQRIRSITDDGAGGVSIEMEHTGNGQVVTQSFKTPADVVNGFRAIYNPQGYALLQQERQKALLKAQEEMAKPQKLSPGQQLVVNGKVVHTAPPPVGAEYVGDDANGNPVYRKVAGGGATGTGKGGKSGEPATLVSQAKELLDTSAQKSEDKLPGDVYAKAQTYLEQLYQAVPNAPPAAAAEVARSVAKNPQLLKPTLNAATGQLDGVFRDQAIAGGQPFTLARAYMTPEQAEQQFKDDKTFMRKQVAEMLARQAAGVSKTVEIDGKPQRVALSREEMEAIRQGYVKAAFDIHERATLTKAAATAGPEAVASLERKLDLIAKYGDPPAAARQPVIRPVGGLVQPVSLAERQRMANEKVAKDKADRDARIAAAPQRAKQLLATGTPKELYAFQGTDEFNSLDRATKLIIHNRLSGIR